MHRRFIFDIMQKGQNTLCAESFAGGNRQLLEAFLCGI
ncbi:hypothetical protein CHK_0861 [Christensenella hongkongensis]|uniref:Uncharacterized protein n=1 Tax=Christensenella hongkongensis TaxID=270498 RepID=A0A0M2NGM8_9FIRM|nr:hypothetical protein CHK_0861 [Christensenella hongkongensis]